MFLNFTFKSLLFIYIKAYDVSGDNFQRVGMELEGYNFEMSLILHELINISPSSFNIG